MRIVIIGEFSSFSKNLSAGFRALGHECFVFSWGDGFKKIAQDNSCSYAVNYGKHNPSAGFLEHLIFLFHSWKESLFLRRFVRKLSKKKKWDVVLVVNPGFIKKRNHFWQPLFSKKMIQCLVKNNKNVYLSACGGDVPFFDYWNNRDIKFKEVVNHCYKKYCSRSDIKHHQYYSTFIDKVIPVMYAYAQAWRCSEFSSSYQVLKTIPLPVNCSQFEINNSIKNRIVIFHGIIRPIEKGTKYIKAAMDKIQEKYPEQVECRAEGGLPLNEYLELLNRTNILIDQAMADSVGMNGLYGLAMGKVVLGGNEPDNQKEFGAYDCPIINIYPDSNQIFEALERLVLNKILIQEISKQSREYVERIHDSKIVAQKYIDTFNNNNK